MNKKQKSWKGLTFNREVLKYF